MTAGHPLMRRRLANFRANRRGFWSLWVFLGLFGLSLFAEFLANGVPGARLEILDPCGHYPQAEQEEAFNRALELFLATIS